MAIGRVNVACAAALWAGCGVLAEGMFNASERASYPLLTQRPSWSYGAAVSPLWFGGPLSLLSVEALLMFDHGVTRAGVNFNFRPRPCLQEGTARILVCEEGAP